MKTTLLVVIVVVVAALAATETAAERKKTWDGQFSRNGWEPSPDSPFWDNGLEFGPYHLFQDVHMSAQVFGDDPTDNATVVRYALAFPTDGWVGFGPSETGSMIGAAPMVVREEPLGSGQFKCIAMHSLANGAPVENSHQNCEIIEFWRQDGETYVMLERPTVDCLPEGINIIKSREQRYIYAYGTSQVFGYHGPTTRSTLQFSPFYGQYGAPGEHCPHPDDTVVLDALLTDNAESWELPPYRDVYFCRQYLFPSDQRYHMIQFDVVTFDIAPATYHHAILYDCPNGLPNRDSWMDMRQCPGAGGTVGCFRFWTGWAAGQQPWCNRDQGQAIGAGELAVTQTFLETHIDNPNSDSGIIDQGWGIRIWMTPTLSPEEQLVYGLYIGFPRGGIPPREDSYVLAGAYGSGCTANIPDEGFFISSWTPHMHGLGRKNHLLLIRADNPTETVVLFSQEQWDFNMQGPFFVPPQEHVRVMPGDTIIGHCDFDTSNKSTPTYFGEGYEDEMCIFFISYHGVHDEYPLTMVGSPDMRQTAPGHYVPDSGVSVCNAPNWIGAWDLSTMALPPDPPSQCH